MDILVLTDLKVSLLAIKRSVNSGKGRSRDLVEVVNEVGRPNKLGLSTQFGRVKAHVGIDGNEHVDRITKTGCRESLLPKVREGGVCARWKDIHSKERAISGLGTGRVVHLDRRAVLRYNQLRMGKWDVWE